jgi:hypothetical protein
MQRVYGLTPRDDFIQHLVFFVGLQATYLRIESKYIDFVHYGRNQF